MQKQNKLSTAGVVALATLGLGFMMRNRKKREVYYRLDKAIDGVMVECEILYHVAACYVDDDKLAVRLANRAIRLARAVTPIDDVELTDYLIFVKDRVVVLTEKVKALTFNTHDVLQFFIDTDTLYQMGRNDQSANMAVSQVLNFSHRPGLPADQTG